MTRCMKLDIPFTVGSGKEPVYLPGPKFIFLRLSLTLTQYIHLL
jgi:hypothetical protein